MGHGETIEGRSSFMAAAHSIGSTRASDGGFQSAVAKTVAVIYETLDAPEEYLPQWACECLSGFL
jgi:hypothetical protein